MNAETTSVLDGFVDEARKTFGDDLLAVVLFGSAAEDRLRPSSDVNVLVLLRAFARESAVGFGAPLAFAATAVRLRAMFLLESELEAAALAFPVKFADIRRRHRVLWGADPTPRLTTPRPAALARLRQVLLNLTLRLRAGLVEHGRYEERLVRTIAEAAGPLRAAAAQLLELEGQAVPAPREALRTVAGGPLEELSRARETGTLEPGVAAATLSRLIELADAMRARAEDLS